MTDSDRIVALEAKLNAAQRELAALKGGKGGSADLDAVPVSMAFTNVVPEKREVNITAVLNERTDLPTLREMERLFGAVKALSPWPSALIDRYDDTRPLRRQVRVGRRPSFFARIK
jgi:hypothetical protein